jgi:hypothetical protein
VVVAAAWTRALAEVRSWGLAAVGSSPLLASASVLAADPAAVVVVVVARTRALAEVRSCGLAAVGSSPALACAPVSSVAEALDAVPEVADRAGVDCGRQS